MDIPSRLNIIHIDMDAFYASVEERDNPKLKGLPIIVGGRSGHGVVTTANYVARRYGVHSAMPNFMAKKLCPRGVFLPVRMSRYQEVSREVLNILHSFTDLVEQVSIDESYVDITELNMDPADFAHRVKAKVMEVTGLTMSIGISYNKFLAKIASDWNKPNGIKVISPDMVPAILLPLKVKAVHGIGPKSAEKLNRIGIYTVGDLINLSEEFLVEFFGKMGTDIYNRIRGIDHREVNTERERKSLGTETTFKATKDMKILESYIRDFSMEIADSLAKKEIQGRTVTVKIKDEDFKTRTKSKTFLEDIHLAEEICDIGISLLHEIKIHNNIRLIGLTISNLSSLEVEQLSFLK
ncbi:MAG: DNA polymerase IV [Tissierellaceae bacterium]|nr:DNA polymerase IV [Tissierellaceae bacterium]